MPALAAAGRVGRRPAAPACAAFRRHECLDHVPVILIVMINSTPLLSAPCRFPSQRRRGWISRAAAAAAGIGGGVGGPASVAVTRNSRVFTYFTTSPPFGWRALAWRLAVIDWYRVRTLPWPRHLSKYVHLLGPAGDSSRRDFQCSQESHPSCAAGRKLAS